MLCVGILDDTEPRYNTDEKDKHIANHMLNGLLLCDMAFRLLCRHETSCFRDELNADDRLCFKIQ